MKHVRAIIKPEMLDNVRAALEEAGYCHGLTITEVMGHGNQMGIFQEWHGETVHLDLLPKVTVDMVVRDDELGIVKQIIIQNANKGENGDGKIFVYDVLEAIRIRTGEEGDSAL